MGLRSFVEFAKDLGWWASKNPAGGTADSLLGFSGNTPVRIPNSGGAGGGDLIQGAGVTLTGTLTGRLIGAGNVTIAAAASAADWTYVVLGSDFATTTGGNAAVTGLEFTPAASKKYAIDGFFLLTTTSATVGPRPGIDTWPTASTARSAATIMAPNSATASAVAHLQGGTSGLALSTGLPSAGTPYPATLSAILTTTTGTTGAFRIGFGSETGGTSVSMLAGSYIRYREI